MSTYVITGGTTGIGAATWMLLSQACEVFEPILRVGTALRIPSARATPGRWLTRYSPLS